MASECVRAIYEHSFPKTIGIHAYVFTHCEIGHSGTLRDVLGRARAQQEFFRQIFTPRTCARAAIAPKGACGTAIRLASWSSYCKVLGREAALSDIPARAARETGSAAGGTNVR